MNLLKHSAIPTLVWVCWAATAAAADEATVTLLDGTTHRGTVSSWDQTSLVVATEEGPAQIAVDELLGVTWGEREAPASKQPAVELIDGSRLVAEQYSASGDVATIGLALTGSLQSTPKAAVARVEMAPLADQLGALWETLEAKDLVGDALVIRKQADAPRATELDYLTGVVQDVTNEQVDFVWDGDTVSVRLGKVAGLAYYRPAAREVEAPHCVIRTVDGSVLAVRRLAQQQGRLHVETVAGVSLKFSPDVVVEADYSMGKLVYLSDLEPLAQQWTPYVAPPEKASWLASSGLPRFDRALDGGPLTLQIVAADGLPQTKSFRKGVALRSYTELVFRVPQEMRTLTALAGIHPKARTQGHVTLEIFADRSLVWQGVIAGDEPPQPIEASIENARRLRLVVGYGENLDYGDQLHLVEARMMR